MTISQVFLLTIFLIIINILWNYHFNPTKTPSEAKYTNDRQTKGDKAIISNKPLPPLIKYTFTGVAIFCLTIGVWLINYWLTTYNLANKSVHWMVVQGRILSKDVISQTDATSTGTQVGGLTYIPKVVYEFTYKGMKHKGQTIDFSNRPAYGDSKTSKSIIDSLPAVGENVNVYINPEMKKSVLRTGTTNTNYYGIIAGVFILTVGFIALKLLYNF